MSAEPGVGEAGVGDDVTLWQASINSHHSSDLDSSQLDELEVSTQPEATKKITKWGVKTFSSWCEKRKISVDFGTVSVSSLAETLRKFYAEVKKQGTKDLLSPSAMVGVRAALHRTITTPPYSRNINIIRDLEFTRANQMFVSVTKKYQQEGNPVPKHKRAIQDADMEKLTTYFETGYSSSPQILLEYNWFLLCYNFGRRGREGWSAMTKSTFKFMIDSENKEYVTYTGTEKTKNHQGGYKQKDRDYSEARMYGKGVILLKFLLSKLHPELDRLFQHPLKNFQQSGPWFRKEPCGKNTLSQIMPNVSKKAGLSAVYTCHCVRASTITNLLKAGVDSSVIIQITKHKNVGSLHHYVSDLNDKQHHENSEI